MDVKFMQRNCRVQLVMDVKGTQRNWSEELVIVV